MTSSATGICAAILAGGRARRFGGRDKSRIEVEGRAIIVRQLEVLRRIADRIFVVANNAVPFADLGLDVLADDLPDLGALGGLYTAVAHATADRVIVVACDLPFLHEGVLGRLTELAGGADGAWVRTARGPEPLLACYRAHAARPIREAIDRGVRRVADLERCLTLADLSEAELANYGPASRLLANLNSPEDLARVQ